MMYRSLWIPAVLAAALAVGLSGCTTTGELDVFSTEQTVRDELPENGTPNVIEGVDAMSTRLLWQRGDESFYAAKGQGDTSDNTCLLIFQGDEGMSGCSTGLPVQVQPSGMPTYMLGEAPVDGDTWMKVADYLYVDSEE